VCAQAAEELVVDLEAASAAAAGTAGRAPLGLRAVEPVPDRRWYLCAFEGPAFLCLTSSLTTESDVDRVREVAAASLLWEHAEALVDPEALRVLARSASRLIAAGEEEPEVADSLAALAQAALALAAWREAPERALAALDDLESGVALHERARSAYGRFVVVTEPLVAIQEELAPERRAALREVEESAGRAALGGGLAARLADAMPDCDEGALQVVAAHLTRLQER
jgi:hypothetical protein